MRIQDVRRNSRAAGLIAGLLLLAWTVPGVAASLELLPETRSPGSEALVRGEDYPAMERIEIRLTALDGGGETDLGSADADDYGLLCGRLAVPTNVAPGEYRVSARNSLGAVLATANHAVGPAPALWLDPISGAPGLIRWGKLWRFAR